MCDGTKEARFHETNCLQIYTIEYLFLHTYPANAQSHSQRKIVPFSVVWKFDIKKLTCLLEVISLSIPAIRLLVGLWWHRVPLSSSSSVRRHLRCWERSSERHYGIIILCHCRRRCRCALGSRKQAGAFGGKRLKKFRAGLLRFAPPTLLLL